MPRSCPIWPAPHTKGPAYLNQQTSASLFLRADQLSSNVVGMPPSTQFSVRTVFSDEAGTPWHVFYGRMLPEVDETSSYRPSSKPISALAPQDHAWLLKVTKTSFAGSAFIDVDKTWYLRTGLRLPDDLGRLSVPSTVKLASLVDPDTVFAVADAEQKRLHKIQVSLAHWLSMRERAVHASDWYQGLSADEDTSFWADKLAAAEASMARLDFSPVDLQAIIELRRYRPYHVRELLPVLAALRT